ncbi:MAG: MauE/DoxX family redox-associated membrane protein [Candidatus Methanofastidiosia archaeon]
MSKLLDFFDKNTRYFILLFRVIVGGYFIYAASTKFANPQEFAEIVKSYQLLPDFAVGIFSFLLPPIELIAGGFLLFGLFTRGSAIFITLLLLIFTGAVSIQILRGNYEDCGCTVGYEENAFVVMGRDIIFLVFTALIIFKPTDFLSIDSFLKRRS